jgi:hypothetical protein
MEVLVINKYEYPFELSARARLNLESSKVDLKKVAVNEQEALRFAFEVCKGACKHVETPFNYDFNTFVDKVEPAVFVKARALAKLLLTPEVFGVAEPAPKKKETDTKKKTT